MNINMMVKNFVADTTSIISYFNDVFQQTPKISRNALNLIDKAICNDPLVRLSIPSVVFLELYDKWLYSEEFLAKFKAEVLHVIDESPNIEIKPIEEEVLEKIIELRDDAINLEGHDKIILASAMMLNCPLITSDLKIMQYVKKYKVIPKIIH